MRYFVMGYGYGQGLKPELVLVTPLIFESQREAAEYVKTCHQSYRAFVVREV